jgi:ribonucleoside-diphosphate reductase alpha chain
MHLDNSACNLASINLLKFLDLDSVEAGSATRSTSSRTGTAVEVIFTGAGDPRRRADYPTEPIAENSRQVPPARASGTRTSARC